VLSLPAAIRIFLGVGAVDFRKAHDGLLAIVRDRFGEDPFEGSLFVFFNRRRDRIKLLLWDRNGFWLFYKRLERGTFHFEVSPGEKRVELRRAQLAMILEGIDLNRGKFRRHFDDVFYVAPREKKHDRPGVGTAR
jgi:transposase